MAADTTDTADGEKTTLKWAVWDESTTPYWSALKDEYEKKNPNVTIEMVDLGSTDYMTVLATELSGSRSDFDLVTIKDVPGYATLVQKNTLEPLSSYIESAGIDLGEYGGTTDQITVDGELYEMPFRSDFWVLFYNKDLFDAAGVDYPTNDMTFDEYDALARKVASDEFGSQVYGSHYHTWRSAVQLFGILDGKHTILDGDYDSSLCGNWGIVKYPHATANVETRGEAVFAAQNAIDGVTANKSHGEWPYASWGINMQDDAQITIDFGRTVVIDRLVMYTRADFPHDNWWTQVSFTFSDGSSFDWELEKQILPHERTFAPKQITSLTMHDMKKADDPSPFPALTQLEVYGHEA